MFNYIEKKFDLFILINLFFKIYMYEYDVYVCTHTHTHTHARARAQTQKQIYYTLYTIIP